MRTMQRRGSDDPESKVDRALEHEPESGAHKRFPLNPTGTARSLVVQREPAWRPSDEVRS